MHCNKRDESGDKSSDGSKMAFKRMDTYRMKRRTSRTKKMISFEAAAEERKKMKKRINKNCVEH